MKKYTVALVLAATPLLALTFKSIVDYFTTSGEVEAASEGIDLERAESLADATRASASRDRLYTRPLENAILFGDSTNASDDEKAASPSLVALARESRAAGKSRKLLEEFAIAVDAGSLSDDDSEQAPDRAELDGRLDRVDEANRRLREFETRWLQGANLSLPDIDLVRRSLRETLADLERAKGRLEKRKSALVHLEEARRRFERGDYFGFQAFFDRPEMDEYRALEPYRTLLARTRFRLDWQKLGAADPGASIDAAMLAKYEEFLQGHEPHAEDRVDYDLVAGYRARIAANIAVVEIPKAKKITEVFDRADALLRDQTLPPEAARGVRAATREWFLKFGFPKKPEYRYFRGKQEAAVSLRHKSGATPGRLFGVFQSLDNQGGAGGWKFWEDETARQAGDPSEDFLDADFLADETPHAPTYLTLIRAYNQAVAPMQSDLAAPSDRALWLEFSTRCGEWQTRLDQYRAAWPKGEPERVSEKLSFNDQRIRAKRIADDWTRFQRITRD